MTEMKDIKEQPESLSPVQQKFILHWGEMGTKWGINRTVAQVHALLFIWPGPLNAEQIALTLSVARSNVSASVRELQGWGLIQVENRLGDRRDYFTTFGDVWEMCRVVARERKKREVDPTIEVLRQCVQQSAGGKAQGYTHQRLCEMLDFLETMTAWCDHVLALPNGALERFAKVGSKLGQWLGIGGRRKK